MAAIIIDEAVVYRLIDGLLQSVATINNGITVLEIGEEEDEAAAAWCRLESATITSRFRNRNDAEADIADVELAVRCGATVAKTRAHATAVACIATAVKAAFGVGMAQDPPAPAAYEHKLDILEVQSVLDGHSDPQRGLVNATVTIKGEVTRVTGTTFVNDL